MREHYFSQQPTSRHDVRIIRAHFGGLEFQFETDTGVFSRGGIDYGTRLLLETIVVPDKGTLLDVGCGYGPIGIVLGKQNPRLSVTMIDINERAVALAGRNASRNGVAAKVYIGDGLEPVQGCRFDVIVTNPPVRAGKSTVYRIFEEAARHLRPHGQFWLVMQKKQGAPSAKTKLESLFATVEDVARSAGYRIFRCDHGEPASVDKSNS
jgi:16S rRNA (guanine1207-N2)-methyltransferase